MWGWADLSNLVDAETGRPFSLLIADKVGPLGPWCRIAFYENEETGLEAVAVDDITSVVFRPEQECTAREEAEDVWLIMRKDGAEARMTGRYEALVDFNDGQSTFDPEG